MVRPIIEGMGKRKIGNQIRKILNCRFQASFFVSLSFKTTELSYFMIKYQGRKLGD
jgi:hypothetical protein